MMAAVSGSVTLDERGWFCPRAVGELIVKVMSPVAVPLKVAPSGFTLQENMERKTGVNGSHFEQEARGEGRAATGCSGCY